MTSVPTEIVDCEESAAVSDRSAWESLLARLSHQSVVKHFDAYGDVEWDSPEMAIDRGDPRFELSDDEPLARTDWYQELPAAQRASLGVDMVASRMKLGLQFEGVLKQGLLRYAAALPNFSPEFRYAYHEVIEEAQHSLMFQEFVNRSGFDAAGLNRMDRLGAGFVIWLARRFPPLFFVFVLGGEDPIDHVQREALRKARDLHPLLERIMRIHVTEEARHLSFARHYLKREVPALNWLRRAELAIGAPVVLASMAQMMLKPSRQIVKRYGIPRKVVKAAYKNNPEHRQATLTSLRKVRRLCQELGLLTPAARRLWTVLGLSDRQPTGSPA
ncbi:MAG: AurF N-oxygenase family protein [Acidimicrobiales bacterium]